MLGATVMTLARRARKRARLPHPRHGLKAEGTKDSFLNRFGERRRGGGREFSAHRVKLGTDSGTARAARGVGGKPSAPAGADQPSAEASEVRRMGVA